MMNWNFLDGRCHDLLRSTNPELVKLGRGKLREIQLGIMHFWTENEPKNLSRECRIANRSH
jgi:hypothetical protein